MLSKKYPRRCVLCKSTTNQLYSFPTNYTRKRIWGEAIEVEIKNIRSRDKVCELHFSRDQFRSKALKQLKDDAVPSLSVSSSPEVEHKDIPKKPAWLRRCVLCRSTVSNLHSFPKDETRKREWAEAIRVEVTSIRSRDQLCDLHFSRDQYISHALQHLKNDAVPSPLPVPLEAKSNDEGVGVSKLARRCVLCKRNVPNLHSFPKDDCRKREWVKAIGLKIENIHTRDSLCDLHFSVDQFKAESSRKLKEDACPSLLQCSTAEVDSVMEESNESNGNEFSETESVSLDSQISSVDGSIPQLLADAVTEVECVVEMSTPNSKRNKPVSQSFTPAKKYFRYYGDIKEEDVQTPTGAVTALKMGQKEIAQLRQQLQHANKKNLALENKIKRLQDQLAKAEQLRLTS